MRTSIVGLLTIAVLGFATGISAAEKSPLGKKIENFSARDFRGKSTSLAEAADSQAVVVAFIGTECPLARQYGPRLAEMATEYKSRGVAFIAIDSNQQDAVSDLAQYAKDHKIEFPLLKDAGNVIADQFGAIRTPEVYLLDKDRVVRYWGRIDDQFGFQSAGIAFQRPEPTSRDLAVALDEVLSGKAVSNSFVSNQGCHIGRIKQPDANSSVTYSKHIASILNNNCVFCHREGFIAPFALTNYEETVGWAEMIKEVVQEQRMPPWHADPKVGHFSNDARLSDSDRDLIAKWVDAGAPEGNKSDLPKAPTFADGWQIPKPDEVIYMADEAFDVPATGPIEYKRFVIDPGWKEDKWIKAMECIPGNPSVVHHIIIYLVPSGVTPTGQAGRLRTNWLGAFAPGLRPQVLADEQGRFVQKGSKLLFEVHYTPNGTPAKDRSFVGFKFGDPSKVKKEVAVQNAGNFTFKIPAGDPNFQVESEFLFRQNSTLLSISPHMHLRGKDFRYDILFPDGKTETILWVPRYDFGWQTTYMLSKPMHLPKGTKMHCVAHFDNSADNFANPDPSKVVGWGEQTFEEMMFGWFEMSLADQDLTQPATASAVRVKEFMANLDSLRLDDETKGMARAALTDDKALERFTYRLMELVPQVDRVCLTSVADGKIRLKMLHEQLGVKTAFHSKSTVVRAEGQSLGEYALGTKTAVNQSMAAAHGSIMANMAGKGIQSSMHVPAEVRGTKCSINFWSSEAEAFPAPAVKVLEELARLMAEGSSIAKK